ncbi:MAG: hypothetical protein J5I81_10045 [Nitrococcus mobilis]|nr:hypothetical protein [Nitrococcus mobilis]
MSGINGWTPERRARQAEAIRRWKPWAKSTGPRTDEGKARSSRNAYRGGHWRKLRELSKAMNALLGAQREDLGHFK